MAAELASPRPCRPAPPSLPFIPNAPSHFPTAR
jgi:hypothetical protein